MDSPVDTPEHPDGDVIRKQVEYYFSDENLPGDAHLLMKTGGHENLPVTIKHICGFPKMRKYKPYTSVVASLRKSSFLDVVDDKYIKRRVPLSAQVTVTPQKIEKARKEEQLKKAQVPAADKPWMTKGMLKPTGFEEYWTDAPVTPAAFKEEQALYNRDISFETRIETAIQRYKARRKFHQRTQQIFNWFMKFGGIVSGPKQFGGGLSTQDLEDRDASEIAAIKAEHYVLQDVMDKDEWEVDFEGVAKGFLSGRVLKEMPHSSQDEVAKSTNVLRNFYNYILHHNVCPEYNDQIHAARKVCDVADKELFSVVFVSEQLPGPINQAFSRLYGGSAAAIYRDNQTWDGHENAGATEMDCRDMVEMAVSAFGTAYQIEQASDASTCKVVYEEELGFEVVSVEMANDEVKFCYEVARKRNPVINVLGQLHCRRWTYPLARRCTHSEETSQRQNSEQVFTLLMERDILESCFVGMKFEGKICELDNGIKWLDRFSLVGPSFFELLPNEFYEKQKALRLENKSYEAEDTTAAQD
ncbi:hypothetical protein MBLNU459_g5677t1 [Dothideomycetes sp. NU459]